MSIIITTCMPLTKVTPKVRKTMASILSKFLPNPVQRVYPMTEADGAYVLDEHNDWFCHVDDDDSRVVKVWYRHAHHHPERERVFGEWVVSHRPDWTVSVPSETEAALRRFVGTINALGGVRFVEGRLDGCEGDPEWLDLADAYVEACRVLKLDVMSTNYNEDGEEIT